MEEQIINSDKKEDNDINIKAKQAIFTVCKITVKMSINDYRIRIYNCLNNHDINNLLLENFQKGKKINISKIICDKCKNKNKGNSYKQIFYRCIKCKKNLFLICKENYNEHDVINYNNLNYICEEHNYNYSFYSKNCK